jgi:hypothetical protein
VNCPTPHEEVKKKALDIQAQLLIQAQYSFRKSHLSLKRIVTVSTAVPTYPI